jgi:hypothetical protein
MQAIQNNNISDASAYLSQAKAGMSELFVNKYGFLYQIAA